MKLLNGAALIAPNSTTTRNMIAGVAPTKLRAASIYIFSILAAPEYLDQGREEGRNRDHNYFRSLPKNPDTNGSSGIGPV